MQVVVRFEFEQVRHVSFVGLEGLAHHHPAKEQVGDLAHILRLVDVYLLGVHRNITCFGVSDWNPKATEGNGVLLLAALSRHVPLQTIPRLYDIHRMVTLLRGCRNEHIWA